MTTVTQSEFRSMQEWMDAIGRFLPENERIQALNSLNWAPGTPDTIIPDPPAPPPTVSAAEISPDVPSIDFVKVIQRSVFGSRLLDLTTFDGISGLLHVIKVLYIAK